MTTSTPKRPDWRTALTFDDFTGPAIVADVFDIAGRDENHDHLWETAETPDDLLAPVWTGTTPAQEGYTVREIPDWEPAATMVLFSPDGSACGFYMGGMLWIDTGHRGRGLSVPMILAAAERLGGQPTQNRDGLGFSPAGMAAHRAAWRALQAGLAGSGSGPDP